LTVDGGEGFGLWMDPLAGAVGACAREERSADCYRTLLAGYRVLSRLTIEVHSTAAAPI